jgi:DNA-binding transcriptional MerR regulator
MEPAEVSATVRLTIGRVAHLAGVSVETVRFYEREHLLPQPVRVEGHIRVYPQEAVTRLRFIRNAKELGFSLAEIRELLELGAHPETACHLVEARAQEKMADIDSRIASLTRMREALETLAARCREGSNGCCPFLEALEREV